MSCGIVNRHGLDLALLWCGLAAVALIQPLAWEPPYAAGVAQEIATTTTTTTTTTNQTKKQNKTKPKKKPKTNKQKKKLNVEFPLWRSRNQSDS